MLGVLGLLTSIMRGLLLGVRVLNKLFVLLLESLLVFVIIKDGVYKGVVKKSFRVPSGKEVNVKDFDVGDALGSLSP